MCFTSLVRKEDSASHLVSMTNASCETRSDLFPLATCRACARFVCLAYTRPNSAWQNSFSRSLTPPSLRRRRTHAIHRSFWSSQQKKKQVQVSVKIPPWARASDVRVDLHRSRLSVSVVVPHAEDDHQRRRMPQSTNAHGEGTSVTTARPAASRSAATDPPSQGEDPEIVGQGKAATPVLAGDLSRPVQVDECLWTIERPGRVLLYLQKELPGDGEPGFEWWACVMEGDPEVDVLACDAGSDASKYPEHTRRRGAKALWEHQNKSPEERLKEVSLARGWEWGCHLPSFLLLVFFLLKCFSMDGGCVKPI